MPCAIRTTERSCVTGTDLVVDGGMKGLAIGVTDKLQKEL